MTIRFRPSAQPLPPDERKANILAAALDLATSYGLQAITPEAVAQAAGVSRLTIVRYYPGGAAGLRDAVVAEAVERETLPVVSEALVSGHAGARVVSDRLRSACKVWIIEHVI
jgi:AcrR family transcriptional regulator